RTHDDFGRADRYVCLQLHIECKYITQHHVLWFDDINRSAAQSMVARRTPFKLNSIDINEHHYLKDVSTVAKLFAGEKTANNADNDPIFKAINQTLHSVVSNKLIA